MKSEDNKRINAIGYYIIAITGVVFSISMAFCPTLLAFFFVFPVILIFSLFLWYYYVRGQYKITLPRIKTADQEDFKKLFPFIYFTIIFCCSLFYWLAYYPGGFNLDAYGQWDQAHGLLPLNDWHPVVSTLIIKAVLLVWDSFSFYIAVQIFFFSASAAILLAVLQKNGISRKILLFTAIFIGVNPAIGLNTICMTKDVHFTILTLNLFSCYLLIYYSKGKWLNKWIHIAVLSLLSVLASTVRHNGIIFIIISFIVLIVYYRAYILKISVFVISTILLFTIIKIPVYRMLEVEPHSNTVGESVGIPMAIMANALVFDKEHIPDDVHSFLNSIASDEEWEEMYYTGEWDSCKWEFGGTELFQNEKISTFMHYMLITMIACPQASYDSFRANTRIVWEPFQTDPNWVPEEYIAENDCEIVGKSIPVLHQIAEGIKELSLLPGISIFFWNTGFHISTLLFIALLFHYKMSAKKIIILLPQLFYNAGTMFLLAGPNQRYFYCNAVIFLPLLFLFLQSPYEIKDPVSDISPV